jgi:FAD/FMN-containing dehydrogenase
MAEEMLAELVAELPDGTVVTDPYVVASYRQDRAADADAGTAIAMVKPCRTEEVRAALRWASKQARRAPRRRNRTLVRRHRAA